MITFKIENRAAEAMIAMLNAVQPNADFVQELTQQYVNATTVVAEEVPAELIKEVVQETPVEDAPKAKKAK